MNRVRPSHLWGAGALLSAALAVGFAQTATPAAQAPTTSQKLELLQRELQQQRQQSGAQAAALQKLRASLAQLSAQQKATLDRLDALAENVATLENEVATLNARTALAQQVLEDTTAQRRLTEGRVARLQEDVRQILNTLYRERSGRYLQLLSQASSVSDLLIQLQYANMAGEHHTRVIATLKGEVAALKEQQAQQEEQTRALNQVQAQRRAKLDALNTRRREQTALLAQLRQSAQGKQALAAQTQAQQALTARTIDTLVGQVVAERTRLEEERRRRLEEERRRREAEARRIREAQERARQEAARLARLRAEQERQARERAAEVARQRAAAAAQAEAQARADAEARARQAQERARAVAAAQQAASERRAQQLRAEEAALQQRQQAAQAEQQRAEEALAPLPTPTGPSGFPISAGRVSAPYGSSGAQWAVLEGADGAQAVAARPGNVIAVTYYASLGWVVLIEHPGLVSVYLGLQEPGVQPGARVAQGAALGAVGGSPVFGPGRMAFQLNRVQGNSRQPVPPGF